MTQSLAPAAPTPAPHPRLHGFVSGVAASASGPDLELLASERWFVSRAVAARRRPLCRLVDEFLEPPRTPWLLLVTGEVGSGRTSFVLSYLAAHERKGAAARQPLTAISLTHPPAIERLAAIDGEQRQRSVVIFDGLDEDPRALGEGGAARRLLELAGFAAGFRRVIVTCGLGTFPRPEDFPRELLGAAPSVPSPVRALEILPLTPRQSARYLRAVFPFPSLRRRRAARALLHAVPALGARPLLLARVPELVERGRSVASVEDALAATFDVWQARERRWAEGVDLSELARRLALKAYQGLLDGRSDRVPDFAAAGVARELGLPWPLPFDARAPILIDGDGSAVFRHRALLELCFAQALLALSGPERGAWLGARTLSWTATLRGVAASRARPGADLAGVDLAGLALRGIDLHHTNLRQARLAGCDLSRAQLYEANLAEAVLAGADLTQANLRGADLTRADLAGAVLARADLCRASLVGTDLREASLAGANLRGADLHDARLPDALYAELAPPGATLEGSVLVEPTTGMRLVWVPGGRFPMGSDQQLEESPVHWVRVSSGWIGETPVTNRQFTLFVAATGHAQPAQWGDPRFAEPGQPVVGVSFEDALAFCRWLREVSGYEVTLPTEAEWEHAARGHDRREYPWGAAAPTSRHACFGLDAMSGGPVAAGTCLEGRGPFGTLDQGGNVWEWCRDVWDELAYVKRAGSEATDPVVEAGDPAVRVVRGGSWFFPAEDLRAAARARNEATIRADDLGFRVVVPARFWPAEVELPRVRIEE